LARLVVKSQGRAKLIYSPFLGGMAIATPYTVRPEAHPFDVIRHNFNPAREFNDRTERVISPVFIILLIISLAELFLANFVFFKGQKPTWARLAAGRCLFLGLYCLFSAFFYSSVTLPEAVLWNQLRTIPFLLLPGLTFLFSWEWIHPLRACWSRRLKIGIIGSSILLSAASFSNEISGFTTRQADGTWTAVSGSSSFWPVITAGWAILLVIFSILFSIFHYFDLDQASERQTRLPIFIGIAGYLVPGLAVGMLPGQIASAFATFLPAWLLIMDILIVYGLTSRRFFYLSFSNVYHLVLQSIPEAVALLDLDARIRAVNPAFGKLTGETETELSGQPINEILPIDPASSGRLKEILNLAGSNRAGSEFILQNGKKIYVRVFSTPIFDWFSRRVGTVLIICDNSRMRESEINFEKSRFEANQKFNSQMNDLRTANAILEEDLHRLKLEEMQWRRRVFELESLTNLTSQLRTARSIQEMLALLLRETTHILEADLGLILLRKGSDLVVKYLHGISEDLKGHSHPFDQDIFWKTYESGQPAFLELNPGDRVREVPTFFPQAASMAVFPLKTSEKQLGLFVLGFKNSKKFNEADQRLIISIGNIASNALYRSNAMDSLEQSVLSRNRELETLYQVVSLANEAREPGAILGQTLRILLETMDSKAGVIYLNDKLNEVHITARPENYLLEIEEDLKGISVENSIWRYIYHTNQPLLVQSLDTDNRIDVGIVTELLVLGSCGCIGAPIRGSNDTIGSICLFKDVEQAFSQEDLALLGTAAHQLGIAIEIIRLRKLEERNAIGAERQRLAGELHDSISQLLSSQFLYVEASQSLMQNGDKRNALENLDQVRRASQQALKEMRLLIHELRPAPIESLGLFGALQHRLETVERRAHIEATLSGDYGFRLPGNVEESLYMIAQDALNYSIRHSQATKVNVHLDSDYDTILLEINDNGNGTEPSATREKNGIARMRERVENLGGNLITDIIPGKGMTLRITI
jgi:PAS domain S-box-containing protein